MSYHALTPWLLIVATLVGCQRSPQADAPARAAATANARSQHDVAAHAEAAAPPAQATDLDPKAMDEALRQALVDLRNRFRCNSISGCRAHTVLVQFGEHARPILERMFPQAPQKAAWRARIVRIVAEMQSPRARPFLRGVLKDGSDKARAYAVYGLVLLDDPRDQEVMHNYANAPGIIASAMTRVAAAWGLAYHGEAMYRDRFIALVREAAHHQLGGATLRWALQLCRQPKGPSCDAMLPVAARHPSYVVRREVLRSTTESQASAEALVMLAADPNPNLARRAELALAKLSGRGDLHGAAAWQKWLASRVATKR